MMNLSINQRRALQTIANELGIDLEDMIEERAGLRGLILDSIGLRSKSIDYNKLEQAVKQFNEPKKSLPARMLDSRLSCKRGFKFSLSHGVAPQAQPFDLSKLGRWPGKKSFWSRRK